MKSKTTYHFKVSLDEIKIFTEEYFKLPGGTLDIKSRKREIVKYRQIAIWSAKKLTKCSLALIGKSIAGRDHATALHSIRAVNNLMETDKKENEEITAYLKSLILQYGMPQISKEEVLEAINKGLIKLIKRNGILRTNKEQENYSTV
jgi:hypothetical protein